MKKITAILVMAMFLLSVVPAAFAMEDTEVVKDTVSDAQAKRVAAERIDIMRDKAKERKDRVVDRAKEHRANIRADLVEKRKDHELRVQELRKELHFKKFNERIDKAREVNKQKHDKARDRYQKATDKYKENVDRYKAAREKASKLKDVLDECKDSEDETCKEKVREHKAEAKRFLLHTADTILAQLEKIEARIQQNEDLSEEEANDLLERLSSYADEIREARATIEELGEDSSREEIKEAANTIRKSWAHIKPKIKNHVERVVNSRIGGIIVRSKHLEEKLWKTLERMENAGKDTTAVEGLVEEFNTHLDDAAESYRKSLNALESDDEESVKEAHALRKEAHASLRKAHNLLKDIHRAIKNAGEVVSDEDVDDSELDDESDEDDDEDESEDDESEDDESDEESE